MTCDHVDLAMVTIFGALIMFYISCSVTEFIRRNNLTNIFLK